MRLVPEEAALADKYKERAFQLYGVNGGDERETAKKAAAEKLMTWPSFYDGARHRAGLPAVWSVDAWPAVYVIGPDGVILYKGHGDEMVAAVDTAMAQAEESPP